MSVTIEIDDETAAEIDRKAKATGQSRAGVVEQAMRTHSASSEKKELPRSRPLPNGQTLAEAMGDFVGCFSNEAYLRTLESGAGQVMGQPEHFQ